MIPLVAGREEGSSTVEAALFFPTVFFALMLFLQIALYYVSVEQAESAANAAILSAKTKMDIPVEEGLTERLRNGSLLKETAEVQLEEKTFLLFRQITATVRGSVSMIYSQPVEVVSEGLEVDPVFFCQMTDLIAENAGKLKKASQWVKEWQGGEE